MSKGVVHMNQKTTPKSTTETGHGRWIVKGLVWSGMKHIMLACQEGERSEMDREKS